MSRALATLPLALVVLVTAASPVAAGGPAGARTDPADPPRTGDAQVLPDRVIATFRDGRGSDHVRAHGLRILADLDVPGRGVPAVVSTNGRPVGDVIAELASDPNVLAVEPDYLVQLADEGAIASVVPVDDPMTGDQYSLDQMRVRDAWSRSTGGGNLIAVLDTGVQSSHPDLEGRVVRGYDFVNDDTRASDDNGHGTWVAGIIAANANDGYGMAGISWTDKILPVKVMSREGTGSTSDLIAGIRYAANKGADIINMSVGGFPYSQIMQDTVNDAFAKGAVLVGAAGNNHREERFYPASFDNVISVSATQPQDEFSSWSSYGPAVDVSAPGSSVMVTNCYTCTYGDHDSWGTHMLISGTSFATPNVSGVLSLIRARFPDSTPQQVVNRLLNTVDDLGYPGWDNRYGLGRVNALRALGATVAQPTVSHGDADESNNGLGSAVKIPLGETTRPSIYPAGDVDVFAVDVPRAGRLDVRVTGIVDSRPWPWHQSGIPVDPVVELFSSSGTLLAHVDDEWETGTELASVSAGRQRIFVRVTNYYPNGNLGAYAIRPTFVDTVAPTAYVADPGPNESDVSRFVDPVVQFSEKVRNVTSSTLVLRDTKTGLAVPSTVVLSSTGRTATIVTGERLEPNRRYRVEVRAGITDQADNPISPVNRGFETNAASFSDTGGTVFEAEIEWLFATGITRGCTDEAFCPTDPVHRGEMATFLARALELPATTTDYFIDDEGLVHEDSINRLAAAGITRGCRAPRYCPDREVTRGEMATFLARALALPPATADFFADDDGIAHEDAINRLAAAGITTGCGESAFCPRQTVSRQEMAAFLYRALSPSP